MFRPLIQKKPHVSTTNRSGVNLHRKLKSAIYICRTNVLRVQIIIFLPSISFYLKILIFKAKISILLAIKSKICIFFGYKQTVLCLKLYANDFVYTLDYIEDINLQKTGHFYDEPFTSS